MNKKKIALIGNMNNANFSILRFLIDLGHDAKLFLYENDASNDNSHFNWENDTWFEDKWERYIVQTPLRNSHAQILSGFIYWRLILNLCYRLSKFLGRQGNFFNPGIPNVGKYIDYNFKEYDLIIGSGNTPGIFSFSKRNLNIFYPYSTGVEYINAYYQFKPNNFKFIEQIIIWSAKKIQVRGIRSSTEKIYNAEMGITHNTLIEFNSNIEYKFIPAVYIEKNIRLKSKRLQKTIIEIKKNEFTILMHSRHKWDEIKNKDETWETNENKNNHWLILAYKKFITKFPQSSSKLLLLNYGEAVSKSKRLIRELELQNNIIWIEKMPRKNLLEIIKAVDIVAGEFYKAKKMIWGGTGWEAFACGKPYLNAFRFEENYFQSTSGIPPPHIFDSNSIDEIEYSIEYAYQNPKQTKKIGEQNRIWFNNYIGLNQAKKWIN